MNGVVGMKIKEFMERISDAMIDDFEDELLDIKTYEELGIETKDKGFEVTMLDKSRFEITIVDTGTVHNAKEDKRWKELKI